MSLAALQARAKAQLRRRVLSFVDERDLIRGMQLEIPAPGVCRLRAFEATVPGAQEILIETLFTVISRGTERAIFTGEPNLWQGYPFIAGYSHVGRVAAAGWGNVPQPGQLVATKGPHASLYLCSAETAVAVPEGVRAEHAALMRIGFIALQGVRKAAIVPGERVAVLGAGLVGQLAAQLAAIAGGVVTLVATSPERLAVARACGVADTLDSRADPARLQSLDAGVVIDATGAPSGIHDASLAAATGARIVLLGSSRRDTSGVNPGTWQRKQLTLLGAHAATVPSNDASPKAWTWRRECELFLQLLARRRLAVDPLITKKVSPADAPAVYEELARSGDKSVAILFDWTIPGSWRAQVRRISRATLVKRGIRQVMGRFQPSEPRFLPARHDGRRLRFGLIGCGEIAVANAAAIRASALTDVTWTLDLDAGLARSLAAAFRARATSSIDAVLASSDVDAVMISVPHHLHASMTIQALDAGKHVVVEKPMALDAVECDRMIDAARRNGRTLSVCYCQRYEPRVRRARELVSAGAIGAVISTHVRLGINRSQDYWRGGATGRAASDWRTRRATAGGGVLIMNACHLLDHMSWVVGSDIIEVASCLGRLVHETEVEDTVSVSYRYRNGAIGTLDVSNAVAGPPIQEQRIVGSTGQLVIAPALKLWPAVAVEGYAPGQWHHIKGLARPAERRHYFDAFAAAVLDGHPPPVLPEEARAVQAAIDAAYVFGEARQGLTVRQAHADVEGALDRWSS
jgi:2-desacetyl-2-hydroxyethyl bacteriochlorophyllide A dehydrogenase